MSKIKNFLFISLLVIIFVEVLIIFPSRLEHEDDAEVRARVEVQNKIIREKEERIKRGEKVEEPPSLGNQSMKGVHLVESQQGSRDWELFAISAEGGQGVGTWKLNNVKVLFYNKEKVEFTVTGQHGTIDSKSKNLSVLGGVVTRSENGYVFKTPSIFYTSQSKQIKSPEEVEMLGPKEHGTGGIDVKGRHMTVLVDQLKMQIHDEVTATKIEKDGKKIEIAADGAEFSGKNREAKFLGAVRIMYDHLRLEGPEASFLYDKTADVLSTINLRGGVRVSNLEKYATAETVSLDLLAQKYVFKGSPRLIQNQDELTGEEIIFFQGGKKVKVERARAKVENKSE